MTAPLLLDANVLIALAIAEHEHHDRASAWAAGEAALALCPITEGALARFLVRTGEHPGAVREILAAYYASGRVEFWPDTASYSEIDLSAVRGHRQITDACLVALALQRGTRLATLDEGLALAHPRGALLLPV